MPIGAERGCRSIDVTRRSADAVARQDVDDAVATERPAKASIAQYRANLRSANGGLEATSASNRA
ncbi:MAG: hypothetical protein EOP66_11925 [Sphingomonas sp.]|nr:MAG: hypothetical protein EOP66_11925 [Sphingomonas sp.]